MRPYMSCEKDTLITLRDALELFLSSADKKSSLYSDTKYELEQVKMELAVR